MISLRSNSSSTRASSWATSSASLVTFCSSPKEAFKEGKAWKFVHEQAEMINEGSCSSAASYARRWACLLWHLWRGGTRFKACRVRIYERQKSNSGDAVSTSLQANIAYAAPFFHGLLSFPNPMQCKWFGAYMTTDLKRQGLNTPTEHVVDEAHQVSRLWHLFWEDSIALACGVECYSSG